MKIPLLCAFLLAAASCSATADWPMLARSPDRKGTTPDEIGPPFARKWYRVFAEEGIQSGVQPVVAAGRVYLGTLRGVMHAMDAKTGSDLWNLQVDGPILHAAGVYSGMVFFGSADGYVYAANSSDGTMCWKFQTKSAVWNAPAIANDTVVIGSRDGFLYALDVVTGHLKWRAQTDGPILNSPALDLSPGVAYVGSESMHVHAFRLSDGMELWKSARLPGASMRGYHPVIAPDGSVLVTVMPVVSYDRFQELLLEMVKSVFGDFASWRHKPDENARLRQRNFEQLKDPQSYKRQMEWLRGRLASEPQFQTLFILDPATGKQRALAPVVSSESMNGPAAPPIVTSHGKVIVKFQTLLRSRYEHYSPFLNVGYLNTSTGDVTPLMDESRTYGWHDSLLLVHDEQCQLTAAGNVLINTHQENVNGLDLSTLRGYEFPFAWNIHEPAPGEALACAIKILEGHELRPGNEWLTRGIGVYGGGSALDTSVVVDGDSFYYLPTHELNSGCVLVAYEMKSGGLPGKRVPEQVSALSPENWAKIQTQTWDWDTLATPRLRNVLDSLTGPVPGTKATPRTNLSIDSLPTEAELEQLIWNAIKANEIQSVNTNSTVLKKLEDAVKELVSREWQPLVTSAGKAPEECYRFFTDPCVTLYTLALVRPFVSPELRRAVDAHAQKLLRGGLRTYPSDRGESRVPYTISPALMRIRNDQEPSKWRQLHAVWTWARAVGPAVEMPQIWPDWRTALDEKRRDQEDCGNGELAGLIAYCDIARITSDDVAQREGIARAIAAIRDLLEYERTHSKGGLIRVVGQNRSVIARWRNLTPEVAHVIKSLGQSGSSTRGTVTKHPHRELMRVYIDYHRPGWWLAWNVEQLMRNEVPTQLPSTPLEIFTARALLLEEPGARLVDFLDQPWCKADEYYIQKLALTLRASDTRTK